MEKRNNYDLKKGLISTEARIRNNFKIWRSNKLHKVSKNDEDISLAKNITLQSMINIIVFTLMLNGIIPALFSEVNIIRIILILSVFLIYLSFYSIILFKDKKDLQKEFRIALKFSAYTYIIGFMFGISLI